MTKVNFDIKKVKTDSNHERRLLYTLSCANQNWTAYSFSFLWAIL
jgi:hypothetical protein